MYEVIPFVDIDIKSHCGLFDWFVRISHVYMCIFLVSRSGGWKRTCGFIEILNAIANLEMEFWTYGR